MAHWYWSASRKTVQITTELERTLLGTEYISCRGVNNYWRVEAVLTGSEGYQTLHVLEQKREKNIPLYTSVLLKKWM